MNYIIRQNIIPYNSKQKYEDVFTGMYVIKVGVQGPAGTKFTINGSNDGNDNVITLGKYGIYELDVSNIGYLTSLVIKSIPDQSKSVYVDYVYLGQGGGTDA